MDINNTREYNVSMWKPKRKEEYYRKKAELVVKTFEETGGDFEKTAKIHWFDSVRSVYRYLKYAGYELTPVQHGEDGRFIPKDRKVKEDD